jgi:hypothetical protein
MTEYIAQKLKSLGFSLGSQIRLYGRTFEIVGEPIVIGRNLVLMDALDADSGRLERVRIPLTILKTTETRNVV